MIKPVSIEPHLIINEVIRYQTQLANWVDQLAESEPLVPYATSNECILTHRKFKLLHFKSDNSSNRPPMVICYALVNRPDILDLQPDRSLIKNFLEQGLDVYLIDWGYPDRTDRYLTLSNYLSFVAKSIDEVANRHNTKPTLMGVCQGGVFALTHAALYPDSISNLITMITPVDFHTKDNTLGQWVQDLDVDKLVEMYGNIPGGFLNSMFVNLKPFLLGKQKYIDALELISDPNRYSFFRRMEHWITDSPDLAGATFQEFTVAFYKQNLFFSEKNYISHIDAEINLSNIKCPILNIYATQDHIVPPSASTPLATFFDKDQYTETSFDTGHIGIYVSNKCLTQVPKAIHDWITTQ